MWILATKESSGSLQADWDLGTDLPPLAAEVRRQATGDSERAQSPVKRQCPVEENGGQAGSRHGDFEGSREGKRVRPQRPRRTIAEVRCRLGPQKVSERRAYRVLDPPRSTQRYHLHRPNDEPRLLGETRAVARQRPRVEAERIDRQLLELDWHVNHKRVHRL